MNSTPSGHAGPQIALHMDFETAIRVGGAEEIAGFRVPIANFMQVMLECALGQRIGRVVSELALLQGIREIVERVIQSDHNRPGTATVGIGPAGGDAIFKSSGLAHWR